MMDKLCPSPGTISSDAEREMVAWTLLCCFGGHFRIMASIYQAFFITKGKAVKFNLELCKLSGNSYQILALRPLYGVSTRAR